MTFRFIDEHRTQWPVRLLCETLEVSPTGYYAWRQRPRSEQQQRRDALVVEIRAIHHAVKARYPDLPVVMFTASGNEEVAVEAMKAGLDDYVVKSARHAIRLVTAVRSALEKADARRRAAQAASKVCCPTPRQTRR